MRSTERTSSLPPEHDFCGLLRRNLGQEAEVPMLTASASCRRARHHRERARGAFHAREAGDGASHRRLSSAQCSMSLTVLFHWGLCFCCLRNKHTIHILNQTTMEGEDSSPGSNSRRGSSVWRRLWALCLARCLPPEPLRPRALAAQGRRLLAPNLDPPLPQTHRSALICPSVTCPTLAVARMRAAA